MRLTRYKIVISEPCLLKNVPSIEICQDQIPIQKLKSDQCWGKRRNSFAARPVAVRGPRSAARSFSARSQNTQYFQNLKNILRFGGNFKQPFFLGTVHSHLKWVFDTHFIDFGQILVQAASNFYVS